MGRKFLLVGLMVLAQGSMRQLYLGAVFAGAFLLFQVQAAPFKEQADDFIASSASFGLAVIFIVSISFKYAALVDLRDIQDVMSTEQDDLYVFDSGILTVLIVISVLGALIVSILIFVIQFTVEARRLQRERLASKARRLRYRMDDEEVRAPAIASDGYHLFLSHVVSRVVEVGEAYDACVRCWRQSRGGKRSKPWSCSHLPLACVGTVGHGAGPDACDQVSDA